MKKFSFLLPIATLILVLISCNNDDDSGVVYVPPHERSDEEVIAQEEIEEFLQTHYYNYNEFENPPSGFDYKIVFDTIAGDNSSKIPLMDQVTYKMVTDLYEDDIEYKMYYLNVRQGEGDEVGLSDIISLNFEGLFLDDLTIFDSAITPVNFDLTKSTEGFKQALVEFNGATGFTNNPDGTYTFDDYGIGAVFVPSGLAYYNIPPATSPIEYYAQLIFTFYPFIVEKADHDLDSILTDFEDLDGDGFVFNDDTDGNGVPNFEDGDDDGDGRLTKYEVVANEYELNPGDPDPELEENEVEMQRKTDDETGIVTLYTVVFTDANNDGVADYLDKEI